MKFIVIFQILIQTQSYITFDSGYNEQFNYDLGFGCTNVNTINTIVSFSDTFETPPHLLIIPSYVSVPNQYKSTFKIDIILITTEQFQLKISCKVNGVSRYSFAWYAINDNRIRILQQPTENNCIDQSIYTHSHNLQQATQAIVFLHSWGMLTYPLNFYLQVYEVTSSTVKIKLNNFNSNLIQVGYQIVLGTSDALQKSELIEHPEDRIHYQQSQQQNQIMECFFSLLQDSIGMQIIIQEYLQVHNRSFKIFNIQYQLVKLQIQFLVSSTYMDSIRFYELWFFEQILFPMYIYSYRVTKKYERFISHPIKVSIIELNSEFYSIGDYEVQVPNTMTKIIIQIELKFYPGEKVVGSFLKCNECGSKNVYKIEQNYLGGNNFIRYRLLLRQYSANIQNLKISIGLSSVNIKQIINQVVEDYQIVQLQFVSLNS